MRNKVGLVVDDRYLDHAISRPSPENPGRLRNMARVVREKYASDCTFVPPREATATDIERIHSRFYLEQIKEHSLKPDPFSYDRDTYLMDHSLYTARLAAGGCLELIDSVLAQELDYGFAMIRPPGHHAEPGRGMGFCVLNNVSITAEYLRRYYGYRRILIVDFDVHHGNGTQEVFYDTDEVLFVSLHQRDIFPFSGSAEEIGFGKGEGYNINIPVYAQFGDLEYTFLLGRLLQTLTEQYLPQIILVSAGYDAHRDDTISGTLLSTGWFGLATAMLMQYAKEVCDNRLVMLLEGGYNPVSLEASVLATIESLLDRQNRRIGVPFSDRANNILCKHSLQKYWTL